MSDNGHEDGPIEYWNIDGQPQPVQIGPRIVWDLRLARCQVQQLADENEQLRADQGAAPARPPDPETVIRRYYRRHARNRRITLKQVCTEMGANYASIRTAKVAYDKRRKRKHKD